MKKQKILLILTISLFLVPLVAQKKTLAHKSFIKWDKNKDSKLSISELPVFAQKNFHRVDHNKNGFISLTEHISFLSNKNTKGSNSTLKIIHNLAYAENENPRQTLDLILPKGLKKTKAVPLVVWIHGGGWKNGDKKTGHSPNRIPALVNTGRYAGATLSYRLSGEAIWPAQIHDCKAAIRWLKANANKFGYNPDEIAVWGSSAGGHLVSMLGTTVNNNNLEGTLGNHLDQTSSVQTVVNYYGPSALLQMNDHPSNIDHNAPDSPESQLMGFPIQEFKNNVKQASPIHHVSSHAPPFIHFHGTHDTLVPYHQSKIFHQALIKKGVKSSLITVEGGGHSMPAQFTQRLVIPYLDHIFYGFNNNPNDQIIQSP